MTYEEPDFDEVKHLGFYETTWLFKIFKYFILQDLKYFFGKPNSTKLMMMNERYIYIFL